MMSSSNLHLLVIALKRLVGDPLTNVQGQRSRFSCDDVNAHAGQNGTRGKFLGFLTDHFMNQEKGFLTNFLYRGTNGKQVTRVQLALVLKVLFNGDHPDPVLAK